MDNSAENTRDNSLKGTNKRLQEQDQTEHHQTPAEMRRINKMIEKLTSAKNQSQKPTAEIGQASLALNL